MRLFRKHIFLAGLFCLVSSLLFAGEKSVKMGVGYKAYKNNSHEILLHSGRYFYGGYSYQFGRVFRNKVQFQISNSNREIKSDINYVSASTGTNIFYDFNYRFINLKNIKLHAGTFIGDDFVLNFFPKLDKDNFLWENQSFVGFSSSNNFLLTKNRRIDLNFRIPIYSGIVFNKMDRLDGEVPGNRPNLFYRGYGNKLLNANAELGYIFSKYGLSFGVYYQMEYNRTGEFVHRRVTSQAHSISFRLLY